MIKFIDYNGAYPRLCKGTLIFDYEGKRYRIENCLKSGGECYYNKYWAGGVRKRPWMVTVHALPDELQEHVDEIENMVNQNVPYGCCGGCL